MRYVDYVLTGDPARAKATVVEALTAWGLRLEWSDEWTASAEKGSHLANIFLGALALHYHFGLEVRSLEGGQALVRVQTYESGWWGGLLGAYKTRKRMRVIRDRLQGAFSNAGVLVSMNEG